MTVAIITGAGGLIGSAAAARFAGLGLDVVGIDNDMRATFFGPEASTAENLKRLSEALGKSFTNRDLDIRNEDGIHALFADLGSDIGLVVHTAAQPSHDWAAREPLTDFSVNAVGTLNLLEATRMHCPETPFIFCSTNKVYGDTPNRLPLEEHELRYEVAADHTYFSGIREDMSIDHTLHSLFGVSKTAADLLVQEYGRYFGMPTVCFRGGTLTGPAHAATELHGFLGYVMRCTMTGTKYTVFGYKGKQVRDAIHSTDVAGAFQAFFEAPRVAEVYNLGGGRHANCSVLEAIALSEEIAGRSLDWSYDDTNRVGDHIWWIGDNGRFAEHYPSWSLSYDIPSILHEIYDANVDRWTPQTP
ncbi:MAG: CDP-paratose 2-epimerase [Actinomycetota bacterium]|jgi:CDP-paratose 2-epimerase